MIEAYGSLLKSASGFVTFSFNGASSLVLRVGLGYYKFDRSRRSNKNSFIPPVIVCLTKEISLLMEQTSAEGFSLDVKDKVCIVTGASSGIGLAIARLLSSKGAYVVLVSRSKEKLEKLAAEIPNSIAVATDMSKAFEVKRMVKEVAAHFDRIDVLVNNAGVGYDAFVEKINIDTYHYVFDLDLVGPVSPFSRLSRS